jgi:hypothetical protein
VEYVAIVSAAIQLARDLIDRGKQTGELTPEQQAALEEKAARIFGKFTEPAPPPEGA